MLKLLLVFRIQQVAVGVQNGKRRHTLPDGNVVLGRDVQVVVHVADVYMDHNVILGEKLGVRSLMIVEIEYLTITTPVSAEVEEDAFVVTACDTLGAIDLIGRVRGLRIEDSCSLGIRTEPAPSVKIP